MCVDPKCKQFMHSAVLPVAQADSGLSLDNMQALINNNAAVIYAAKKGAQAISIVVRLISCLLAAKLLYTTKSTNNPSWWKIHY